GRQQCRPICLEGTCLKKRSDCRLAPNRAAARLSITSIARLRRQISPKFVAPLAPLRVCTTSQTLRTDLELKGEACIAPLQGDQSIQTSRLFWAFWTQWVSNYMSRRDGTLA